MPKKSDVTVTELAEKVDKLTQTVDDLAAAVAHGFEASEERNEQRHQELRTELKGEIQSFREEASSRFDGVEKKLDSTITRTDVHEEYLDEVGEQLQLPTLAEFANTRRPLS